VSFDKQEFFKKQIQECRELERQAVDPGNRAFWRQAAARWEEQLRQAETQARKKAAARRVDKSSFKYTAEA
jgi:hypothetical protein